LNPFEIKLIRFENRIGRTVLPTPPVSAAPTASPCCLTLHPPTDDRAPVSSWPTYQPRRPASRRLRRPSLSRMQRRRPRAPRLGRCRPMPRRGTVPAAPRPTLSLSLSHSASTRRPPLHPPPRCSPLKQSHRSRSNFLPRAAIFPLSAPTPCRRHIPRLRSSHRPAPPLRPLTSSHH
jgi:hypothetical protein